MMLQSPDKTPTSLTVAVPPASVAVPLASVAVGVVTMSSATTSEDVVQPISEKSNSGGWIL